MKNRSFDEAFFDQEPRSVYREMPSCGEKASADYLDRCHLHFFAVTSTFRCRAAAGGGGAPRALSKKQNPKNYKKSDSTHH